MKNDDRKDLIFDDLYEPDIPENELTEKELKSIENRHNQIERG